MNIVFTKEDRKTARKHIPNFKQSYLIDARDIILEFDYMASDVISTPQDFIINKEIEKKLAQALVNKKSIQIVYFHYKITPILLKNVREFFNRNEADLKFCLFDSCKSMESIWHLFDEVYDVA